MNLLATHKSTWELTTDSQLTTKGDCIIGVRADYSAASLPPWLKKHLQAGEKINYTLSVNDQKVSGTAVGHPNLAFTNPSEMVIRISDYTCGRTLAINSTLAARDLPSKMKELLQSDDAVLTVTITAVEE